MDEDYDDPKSKNRGRSRVKPRTKSKSSNIKGLKLGRRNKIESDEDEQSEEGAELNISIPTQFDQDCDISALEAPTFTTLDRGPPAPMLSLTWNHPVNLIGEKVLSPRIHICDICNKPVLIYGRMIPCKHVFCLTCAKAEDRSCTRCGDRVARVEQTGLGTVHMCTYNTNDAICKRTYLSQRDLQAHIAHRHVKSSVPSREECHEVSYRDPRAETRAPSSRNDPRSGASMGDPRTGAKDAFDTRQMYGQPIGGQYSRSFNPNQPPPSSSVVSGTVSSASVCHHIPVMTSSRTNLITVPLQDQTDSSTFSTSPLTPSHPPPHGHAPPPHPFTTPPPIVTYAAQSAYSKVPPQYTYPSSAPPPNMTGHPPPFSSTMPPVPVPPPTTYGSHLSSQYEPQYSHSQWSTPPPSTVPQHPPRGPPPNHHLSQQQFYR